MARVFISYAHEGEAQCERVLQLARRAGYGGAVTEAPLLIFLLVVGFGSQCGEGTVARDGECVADTRAAPEDTDTAAHTGTAVDGDTAGDSHSGDDTETSGDTETVGDTDTALDSDNGESGGETADSGADRFAAFHVDSVP